jgi:lipoprotein-anchoring transpeptidase ErfK/SrfK
MLMLVPTAMSDVSSVVWSSPTPADRSHFDVNAGAQVSFELAASADVPGTLVRVAAATALPKGSLFTSADGAVARGSFSWKPQQGGDYALKFVATNVATHAAAAPVTYTVHVRGAKPVAKAKVQYPLSQRLADDKVAHWAAVLRRGVVRAQPRANSRRVTTLDTRTSDDTQNIVLALQSFTSKPGQTWYRVRLPILPNNSTGWVQSNAVGKLFKVNTHLYVDRAHFRATLKRNGRVIFTSIVGVGRSIWPTPRGEFYIRDKLSNFNDPFYGPIAFGTSARSATLTDWPGGGFVGVHGTNQPSILPGRVSHGCIRMPNENILKLARLMPVGTPVTIT